MAVTRDWNAADPANSDKVGTGASDVRDFRQDVAERQQNGGTIWDHATYTRDGRHAISVTTGTGFKIYKNDTTDDLAFDFTAASMDAQSGVNFTGGNVTTGDQPGHRHLRTIVFSVPGTLTAGHIKQLFRFPNDLGVNTFELKEVRVAVWARPAAVSTMTFNIYKILAANTGPGIDPLGFGTSIFTGPGVKPTVTDVNYRGSTTTFSSSPFTFTANDEIRCEIEAPGWTGSPTDLVIELTGLMR